MPTQPTDFLTFSDLEKIAPASGFADQIGLPLNHHLTVSFGQAEVAGKINFAKTEIFKRLSHLISPTPLTYVATWENSHYMGIHLHALIHLPGTKRLGIEANFHRWLCGIGATPDDQTVNLSPIRYTGQNRWGPLKGVLRYILKGLNPDTHGFDEPVRSGNAHGPFGIELKPQGQIPFKRYSISQNLGESARRKHSQTLLVNRASPSLLEQLTA
jgi:hypothetical protein